MLVFQMNHEVQLKNKNIQVKSIFFLQINCFVNSIQPFYDKSKPSAY